MSEYIYHFWTQISLLCPWMSTLQLPPWFLPVLQQIFQYSRIVAEERIFEYLLLCSDICEKNKMCISICTSDITGQIYVSHARCGFCLRLAPPVHVLEQHYQMQYEARFDMSTAGYMQCQPSQIQFILYSTLYIQASLAIGQGHEAYLQPCTERVPTQPMPMSHRLVVQLVDCSIQLVCYPGVKRQSALSTCKVGWRTITKALSGRILREQEMVKRNAQCVRNG